MSEEMKNFLCSFKSQVKFTITGNGVVHARASEILKSDRAQRQISSVAALRDSQKTVSISQKAIEK